MVPVTTPALTVDADGAVAIRFPDERCPDCEAIARMTPSGFQAGCSRQHGQVVGRFEPGVSIVLVGADLTLTLLGRNLVNLTAYTDEPLDVGRLRSLWRRPARWGVSDAGDVKQVLTAVTFAAKPQTKPRRARPWVRAGIPQYLVKQWEGEWFTAAQAKPWIDLGMSEAYEARQWIRRGHGPEHLRAWVEAGNSPYSASQWRDRGISLQEASGFDYVHEWDFAAAVGAFGDPEWGALADVTGWQFASQTRLMGRTAQQTRTLAEALTPAVAALMQTDSRDPYVKRLNDGAWPTVEDGIFAKEIREAGDVDWDDLALCVRAGMPLAEGLAYLRDGGDVEPVRVMASLL